MYVHQDGGLAASQGVGGTDSADWGATFEMGDRMLYTPQTYARLIDDFRIYNYALSADWIKAAWIVKARPVHFTH
jgi:hypothetical protein